MQKQALLKEYNCCVVIPTYNNERTLAKVISDVLEYTDDIIVVNDGSTDSTSKILQSFGNKIKVLEHPQNLGKGKALFNAFQYARQLGFDYVISIDSDGQHFASDLPLFTNELEKNPNVLLIGSRNLEQEHIPIKSSFGNRFSTFWFWAETGVRLKDTQSGYRLYPIAKMKDIKLFTSKFEFEIEAIVKSAWKGIEVKNIPIKIHYEIGDDRVTHFKPFKDSFRISVLNTYLFTLAVLYHHPLQFIRSINPSSIKSFIKKNFFDSTESARKKALSIGFGVFMGIFPVWGYQMILGLVLAHYFKMNKALFLVAANISIPPMIPLILYGSYKAGTLIIENDEDELMFDNGVTLGQVTENILQYLVGAVLLAVVAGVVAGMLTYITVVFGRNKEHSKKV